MEVKSSSAASESRSCPGPGTGATCPPFLLPFLSGLHSYEMPPAYGAAPSRSPHLSNTQHAHAICISPFQDTSRTIRASLSPLPDPSARAGVGTHHGVVGVPCRELRGVGLRLGRRPLKSSPLSRILRFLQTPAILTLCLVSTESERKQGRQGERERRGTPKIERIEGADPSEDWPPSSWRRRGPCWQVAPQRLVIFQSGPRSLEIQSQSRCQVVDACLKVLLFFSKQQRGGDKTGQFRQGLGVLGATRTASGCAWIGQTRA